MQTYIFDIEGNGLQEIKIDKKGVLHGECTRIHCLVLRSYPDGKVQVFRHNDNENTIAEGWQILQSADVVIGHNIIMYDLPVLQRLYGGEVKGRVFDTLVAAKVLWPDAKHHPFGGNSLESFGKLLKCFKGDYTGPWDAWSQTMEDYCVQDTLVSAQIFNYVKPKAMEFRSAVRIEHRIAEICAKMQDNGVSIDLPAAEALIERLELERCRCEAELQAAFPPLIEEMKTPQYWFLPDDEHQRWATKSAAPSKLRKQLKRGPNKLKEHPFNPNSSYQIAERLKERYDWDAPVTEAGNPSIDEDTLKGLKFPEATLLLHAQMADKRLQHLTDWTRRARASRTPGRIHPQINHLGCNTSRASHQQPNQTACPKVVSPELRGFEGRWGWECRSLWGPREGWDQVGGDASGIELRMLGAMLYQYDGGAYAREVVSGDVHTMNMKAGGLDTRDQSKTTIYAYLYGAGDEHIGEVITEHPSLSAERLREYYDECQQWIKAKSGRTRSMWLKAKGREFRAAFEKKIPALARLSSWCKQCASSQGFVPLLDGRHAPCRSEHSALNVYLQGNAAIVMKVAMILLENDLTARGWLWKKCAWMLWPHDEFQFEADPSISEEVGKAIVRAIVKAGEKLKLDCPLDGEYKVGKNWAECH